MKIDQQHCTIVTITEANLTQHPQVICYINPKQDSYGIKLDWIKQRLKDGLVIKLLYMEGEKKAQGFIEYIPGEYAWRAVSAPEYMFIHCIWVYANAYKNKGIGSLLIKECIADAEKQKLKGVAVVASHDAFMAKPELFLKNGFSLAETAESGHELLVKQSGTAPLPRFNKWQAALKSSKGLHLIYSNQCPWVARFVSELDSYLKEHQLKLTITELKTAAEAQTAPSPYATFTLINLGKILADHYISLTRFANILKKEKLIPS